ncbi:MAG: zinc-dependent metalloprotease [Cyanobacteria bacterium P01_F01_bin.150]
MKRWIFLLLSIITLLLVLIIGSIHSWHRPVWSQPFPFPEDVSIEDNILDYDIGIEDGPPLAFEDIIADAEKLPGLFTVYHNQETDQLYLELTPRQLNQNFISVTTLNSGLGEFLYRGFPLGDFTFQFRKVRDSIQVVVPNIYFRTDADDPQRQSIERSFSDSTIASLPILSTHPDRETYLVNWSDVLLGGQDITGFMSTIGLFLGGYYPNPGTSYLQNVQSLPENMEIDTSYGFSGGGSLGGFSFFSLNAIPDSRAFNLDVHFSISKLPTNNGYQSRLADERVGYFVTAHQDLSKFNRNDTFIRYIDRWHLEKANPELDLSPPKKPIVFWIENTVPFAYRDAIRDGILSWNKAFEAAGFQDAIEARQMPDDADWDPADVRYNTVRWTNSLDFFGAIGVRRVNPLTGEILDGDVVIDAGLLRFMQNGSGFIAEQLQDSNNAHVPLQQMCHQSLRQPYWQWLTLNQQAQLDPTQLRQSFGRSNAPTNARSNLNAQNQSVPWAFDPESCFGLEIANNGALGALALTTVHNILPSSEEMQTFVNQYLTYLTAHEIGHTLGLRHNFRGSTMLSPEDLNDTSITQEKGLTGSVMDYVPVNLAPPGTEQGDFFSTMVGPYDQWAIEYGYTETGAVTPSQEWQQLDQIASRAAEPGLSYATDEDAFDYYNSEAVRWDMSSDPLTYSQGQMDNVRQLWDKLHLRYPIPGESYSELRDRFDIVFFHYLRNATTATRYIGGQVFNRDRRGDPGGREPFELIPLEQQREAINILQKYVFAADAFDFSPRLIRQLAPSRWWHWGSFPVVSRLDYPVYDRVSFLQTIVLSDLLSSERLGRLRDVAFSHPSESVLTISELFESVEAGIWAEIKDGGTSYPSGQLEITSLRRSLQRQYINILSAIMGKNSEALNDPTASLADLIVAFRSSGAPNDAKVLARYQLTELDSVIQHTLRTQAGNLEITTQAHLEDIHNQILQLLTNA